MSINFNAFREGQRAGEDEFWNSVKRQQDLVTNETRLSQLLDAEQQRNQQRQAAVYLSPLLSYWQQAANQGTLDHQWLINQRAAIQNDPNFAKFSPEVQQEVWRKLGETGLQFAQRLKANGDIEGYRNLLNTFGISTRGALGTTDALAQAGVTGPNSRFQRSQDGTHLIDSVTGVQLPYNYAEAILASAGPQGLPSAFANQQATDAQRAQYMELLQTLGAGSGATPAGQLAAQLGGVDGTQVNVGGSTAPVGVQPTVQPTTAIGTDAVQQAQQAAPTQPAMVTPEAVAAARAEFEAAQRETQDLQDQAGVLNRQRLAYLLGGEPGLNAQQAIDQAGGYGAVAVRAADNLLPVREPLRDFFSEGEFPSFREALGSTFQAMPGGVSSLGRMLTDPAYQNRTQNLEDMSTRIAQAQQRQEQAQNALNQLLGQVPNTPQAVTPVSGDSAIPTMAQMVLPTALGAARTPADAAASVRNSRSQAMAHLRTMELALQNTSDPALRSQLVTSINNMQTALNNGQ